MRRLGGFKDREDFEKFINTSYTCVCGQMLTGLHELNCEKLQLLKIKWTGKQDSHPAINVPKVTE